MRRAFTLIEILMVVAIIAILAAIAVPNLLESQMRSKVARARSDMRTMAVAIEAYAADSNQYPAMTVDDNGSGSQPGEITTPVAYMTTLPVDCFTTSARHYFYESAEAVSHTELYEGGVLVPKPAREAAAALGGAWWLQSAGPDRDPTNTPPGVVDTYSRVYRDYDPTNGTISLGNIFRTQRSPDRLGIAPIFYENP
jgi:type II secretion system protein G